MTIISISDLTSEAKEGKIKFKVGDEIVFVNGGGMWSQLNGLTGKIIETSNNLIYTFCITLDREDLIEYPLSFLNEKDEIKVWCSTGNLYFEDEIPNLQKKDINRGQSKIKPVINLDDLFPSSAITHKLLEISDLPNLFAPEDILNLDTSENNKDWLNLLYKNEFENNPNNILFAMRYVHYLIKKGYMVDIEKIIHSCLVKFPKTLDTFQQFYIPIARAFLTSGENKKTKDILLSIPEQDRNKLGGYKNLISVIWRLDRKIEESQVVKPFLEAII